MSLRLSAALMSALLIPAPAAAQGSVSFEELLRIPSAADQGTAFHIPLGKALTAGDTVWIVDLFNSSVRVFDARGRLVREFGRSGGGPGEFQMPIHLTVASDHVDVADNRARRITRFSRSGEYLSDRPLPPRVAQPGRSPYKVFPLQGGLIAIEYAPTTGGTGDAGPHRSARVLVLDTAGVQRQVLAEYSWGEAYAHARGRPEFSMPIAGAHGRGGHVFASGDSLLAIVDDYVGAIRYFAVNGDSLRLLRRRSLGWSARKVDVTSEQQRIARGSVARGLRVPESQVVLFHPEHEGVIASGELASNGDLWLRRRSGNGTREEVFRDEYLIVPWNAEVEPYTAVLPENILFPVVTGDRLLGVHLDTDRVTTIRVYRIVRAR